MKLIITALIFLANQAYAHVRIGRISSTELKEISGMTISRTHQNVMWLHNDSGDEANLFAVSLSGELIGKFIVSGGSNKDWEDLASGKCPHKNGNCLFIGDIGDKNGSRKKLSIMIIEEPLKLSGQELPVEKTISFDGRGMNFESLAWDEGKMKFYMIEKKGKRYGDNPKNPSLYSLGVSDGNLSFLKDLDLKPFATENQDTLVTAADYQSASGKLVVGTYGKSFILDQAFNVEKSLDLPVLPKAEAMAWGPEGIYVTGEDEEPVLWRLSI